MAATFLLFLLLLVSLQALMVIFQVPPALSESSTQVYTSVSFKIPIWGNFIRKATYKRSLISNVSFNRSVLPTSKWSNHGLTIRCVPRHDSSVDINIFLDITQNPGTPRWPSNKVITRTKLFIRH